MIPAAPTAPARPKPSLRRSSRCAARSSAMTDARRRQEWHRPASLTRERVQSTPRLLGNDIIRALPVSRTGSRGEVKRIVRQIRARRPYGRTSCGLLRTKQSAPRPQSHSIIQTVSSPTDGRSCSAASL